MEKTAADYSNEIAELDKEIALAIRNKEEVQQAIYRLQRERIALNEARSKASCNLDLLKNQRSLLMHAMFNARNSGL